MEVKSQSFEGGWNGNWKGEVFVDTVGRVRAS